MDLIALYFEKMSYKDVAGFRKDGIYSIKKAELLYPGT